MKGQPSPPPPPHLPSCQSCLLCLHCPSVRPGCLQMLLGHKPTPGVQWCSGGNSSLKPCFSTIDRGVVHQANLIFIPKSVCRRWLFGNLFSAWVHLSCRVQCEFNCAEQTAHRWGREHLFICQVCFFVQYYMKNEICIRLPWG